MQWNHTMHSCLCLASFALRNNVLKVHSSLHGLVLCSFSLLHRMPLCRHTIHSPLVDIRVVSWQHKSFSGKVKFISLEPEGREGEAVGLDCQPTPLQPNTLSAYLCFMILPCYFFWGKKKCLYSWRNIWKQFLPIGHPPPIALCDRPPLCLESSSMCLFFLF